ncbi:MAG: CDP-alcohol phosphatidyltransferase family protein [Bacteroidaceae bacterium]|nr:CDP-alcohol phosphatidyltransferase family protein [Bacteroidaceae bacterium]
MKLREKVLATMKSTDTESRFELYVTRTPGYLWALLFSKLGVHPIAVTLLSIVIGATSGYFFYQTDLRMNIIGICLLIWANWYDCADGQLARMTGKKTLIGRILDGFAGDVWFFCIYLGFCLRLMPGWGLWIWPLAAWAGLRCHGRQCAIGDYYRNIHLWFFLGREGSELATSRQEKEEYRSLKWCSSEWFHKLYLFFYIRYTKSQEDQTPVFQQLFSAIQEKLGGKVPEDMRRRFRQDSLPLMPITNILTFDTRAGVLFLSVLIGMPWIYFIFESTVLEVLRYRMIHRHEGFCRKYLDEINSQNTNPGLTPTPNTVASGDSLPFVGPKAHSVLSLKTPVAPVGDGEPSTKRKP